MADGPKPKPCHWCGGEAESHLDGSYVEGWTAYVACRDYLCGARGPSVRTGGHSNDDHETEDEAVRRWNEVGSPMAAALAGRRRAEKKGGDGR